MRIFNRVNILLPFLFAAFWPLSVVAADKLPIAVHIGGPAVLCVPYVIVAMSYGQFRCGWFTLYLLLPVMVSWLLYRASLADPEQRGDWRDFLVLAALGLAVDLRWFESAWPPHLAVFSKMLLLDAGIPVFSPIAHFHAIRCVIGEHPHDFWMAADKPFMDAAHGLIVLELA